MTSFANTGSTFEKVVEAWLMQNLVLYSLAQTAVVAEKSNFKIFKDVIRAYQKYFRKGPRSYLCTQVPYLAVKNGIAEL